MRRRTLVSALGLALAGCAAPHVQPPLTPPAGFVGPHIAPDAFIVHDGARLPYRRWSPEGPSTAVIVALHGMNDNSNGFRLAGPWWAGRGIETWAYDQRGFGFAPGRGEWAGEAAMVEDLRTVVALVRAARPGVAVVVVGESMGGAVAVSAFASDRPPEADRVVLLAPAVWGWSSQGPANRAALWVAARAMGARAVGTPDFIARRIRASDNIEELIRNGRDPGNILSTRFDALAGLVDLMESASTKLGRMRGPTLLMYGAHDQIIEKAPMRRALERAGSPPNLITAWYPDGWHLLNRDLSAPVIFADVAAWIAEPAALLPSEAPPVLPRLRPGAR